MSKILPLSSDVVDQIAAGEVVERPAHLLKELIENSLDAGANEIEIRASRNARDFVVKDNGSGIDSDEIAKALDRFATSKIVESADLWKLKTFGFRGEALASLAAVSHLTLKSKPQAGGIGSMIESIFGDKKKSEPVGLNPGTEVWVKSLFENLPARLKFMKAPATEISQCRTLVKAMALSHPKVSWRFFIDDDLDQSFKVSSQEVRAKEVLELKSIYYNHAEISGVRVTSYFGDPYSRQKSAKNIWIFAQSRWVQDRTVVAAVNEAYRSLLMHGEYPAAAVFIETNPANIDVNIHPTKSQVKWLDSNVVYRAVVQSIRPELEKAPWKSEAVASFSQASPTLSFSSPQRLEKVSVDDLYNARKGRENFFLRESPTEFGELSQTPMLSEPEVMAEYSEQIELEPKAGFYSSLFVSAQVHKTYLLCSSAAQFLMVDQHAAHERVLYERLMQQWKNKNFSVQEFLIPLTMQFESDEVQALLAQTERFKILGITLESLGPNTLAIRSSPLEIKEKGLVAALSQAARQIIEEGDSFSVEELIGNMIATMACHSAIRAGEELTLPEMNSLLSQMDEFPLSSFCPHGRPVHIEWSWLQIEKLFGRKI